MLRRPRGQVLVIFALALFVLLGFAALGIDVGYMYTVRHELQRCADAGALAGASAFLDGDWADADIQAVADSRARDYARRDTVVRTPLGQGEVEVGFDAGRDRIRVDTFRDVNLFFSRIFLGPTTRISARAVAEAREVTRNVQCVVPWGIPLPWEDIGEGEPNMVFDNDDIVHTPEEGCDPGWPITYYNTATHQVEGAPSPRDTRLCQGSLRILKIGDPGGTLEPGHFLGLDLSSVITECPPEVNVNSGASLYNYLIKHPCACGSRLSESNPVPIDLKTGEMVGPTVQAVAPDAYKGSQDVDSLMNEDPEAVWNYEANLPSSPKFSGDAWQSSPRVVRIPLYDPRNPPSQGKDTITPTAFAGFWVQDILVGDKGQGTVIGRFIPLSAMGESEGNAPGTGGPTLKMLRLVE